MATEEGACFSRSLYILLLKIPTCVLKFFNNFRGIKSILTILYRHRRYHSSLKHLLPFFNPYLATNVIGLIKFWLVSLTIRNRWYLVSTCQLLSSKYFPMLIVIKNIRNRLIGNCLERLFVSS